MFPPRRWGSTVIPRFPCLHLQVCPTHAGTLKERTFETRFNLRTGQQRKPTVSKHPKKDPPKAQKPKTAKSLTSTSPSKPTRKTASARTPMTAEAKAEARRQYDNTRSQSPELQEAHRRYTKEKREQQKSLGLCRSCPNPAIPGQIRCPTCAEEHRQARRRS